MCLFAQYQLTTLLFLAALVLTIGWLLLRSQRHLSRRSADPSSAYRIDPPGPPRKAHHLDGPPETAPTQLEMHEAMRELSAELDTKLDLLQQLIREADRAAARLEAALEAARTASPQPAGAQRPEPAADHSSTRPRPAQSQAAGQAEALRSASADHDEGPGFHDTEASVPTGEKPPPERRFLEIYTLADSGFDATEIARRVGTPVGEVELILSLRAKR